MNVLLQREERPEGGWLARVTIDNTGKLNSLNRALMGEIVETVAAFASDPQLRLAILTGAGGRALSAGPISARSPASITRARATSSRWCIAAATPSAAFRSRS